MQVLIIGKGGREHALAKALQESPQVSVVHVLPGNSGIGLTTICHPGGTDSKSALAVCKKHQVDLVVIGPEVELAQGLADDLRGENISVFGPGREAARLEASKVFSKNFMSTYNVPTSRYYEVSSVEETLRAAENFAPPYVLKADGLAAGKGVVIAQDIKDLERAADSFFNQNTLGEAGHHALLEEFQHGWETSVLVMTNGQTYQVLPFSQDNKRLLDGDQGPNTGGMGVVAPLQFDHNLEQQIHDEILKPSIAGLKDRGWDYRGILYVGIMVTSSGPKVIEYNVRFGDPEAQVVLPLLDGDWGQVLHAVAEGKLPNLSWKPVFSACVVLAAENYPSSPKKGVRIEGELMSQSPSSYFLHAGTQKKPNTSEWETAGGRVLNAIGLGSTMAEAVDNAYAQAQKVKWPGMQMRTDIGQKVL